MVQQQDIISLVQLMRDGALSSEELTAQSLERIKRAAELNCFIEVCEEQALAQARESDKRRKSGVDLPLLGVPVAIKDMILTKSVRTTAASRILENFIPPYDATVTARLKAAGAVIIGKTNMDEFAMGSSSESSYFGPVKNPWDTSRVPGGSSGGSSAAVAARLVPGALGTDTGGSVRQPAALCNVVGLKPTYGRVSRYGVIAYASSFDQVGVMSRTVRDSARMLRVISGWDEHDSTSVRIDVPEFERECAKSIAGLRVGIPREFFIGGLDPQVERAVRDAVSRLEKLGMKICEISLPHTELALSVYYILVPAEASSNLSRYDGIRYGYRAADTASLGELYSRSRSEGFGSEVKRRILIGTHVLSTGYYEAFYRKAQQVRALFAADYRRAFSEQCDVIACPVSPTTAFRLGEKTADPLAMYLSDVYTLPVNLAGLPALSVPCGFDNSGLPIGLQLIGKHWDEGTLLACAAAYERETEFAGRAPAGYESGVG